MSDENQQTADILGRMIALELLITNYLIDHCSNAPSGDVLSCLKATKAVMFQSLQNIRRPVGDFEDQVWEQAISSLDRLFANAAARAIDNGWTGS